MSLDDATIFTILNGVKNTLRGKTKKDVIVALHWSQIVLLAELGMNKGQIKDFMFKALEEVSANIQDEDLSAIAKDMI